jgi:hypothetical protein
VRPGYGSFIADRYGSAALFQNDYLFGIVVFVEWDHSTGFQNLVSDVEVLGVSVQLVDLDDEFRNGLGTGWSLGTAQTVLAIILFEN